MANFLTVSEVSKAYKDKAVLKKVSFELEPLQNLAIIGSTGSSKTTLLKSLAGLLELDRGIVKFHDEKVKGPSSKLVPGHTQIKYLAQHFELPKFITVLDYLDRPAEIQVEDPTEIYNACNVVHLLERDTLELSGGERQRVALAKEILKAPDLLLLDEPFSNLDYHHKQELRRVLKAIKEDLGVTTILVAHDPKDVMAWADQILVMKQGEIEQLATPKELYNDPKNEYVAGLLGVFSSVSLKPFKTDVTDGPQMILRPHHVHVSKLEGRNSGKVLEVIYYGSHELLAVLSNDQKLFAIAPVGHFEIGEDVLFEIKQ